MSLYINYDEITTLKLDQIINTYAKTLYFTKVLNENNKKLKNSSKLFRKSLNQENTRTYQKNKVISIITSKLKKF